MNAAMTIEEFNVFMQSDQQESALLNLLRKLARLEKPEDVRAMQQIVGPQVGWQGWAL